MAHFAKLDSNNIVLEVIVVNNSELLDENNQESEQKGIDFLISLYGHTNWKQTSYNAKFRKHYAVIGDTYDPIRDVFIPFKTFNSWVLNEQTYNWDPPTPYPVDGKKYYWDEVTLSWVEALP